MSNDKKPIPELAAGQIWRRRDGTTTRIVGSVGEYRCDRGWYYSGPDDGCYSTFGEEVEAPDDLMELVSGPGAQDACPFTEAAKSAGYVTKDSGVREEMATGSVRDSREGKGRFELVSPFALARLAGVYERGAAKYASRNWEKGQPYSRFLDSAMRHLNRFAMGWRDEDHLAQAAWNIFAIMHFQELGDRPELDDMPHYQDGPKGDMR